MSIGNSSANRRHQFNSRLSHAQIRVPDEANDPTITADQHDRMIVASRSMTGLVDIDRCIDNSQSIDRHAERNRVSDFRSRTIAGPATAGRLPRSRLRVLGEELDPVHLAPSPIAIETEFGPSLAAKPGPIAPAPKRPVRRRSSPINNNGRVAVINW